ncbi:MAG: hypothetical protein P8N94_04470 [Gammaproteobacteria bacterium]|nr:hypothetical protein [Gammaproteobacteria bacterium]
MLFGYWDKLYANDPVQNPIYMQQRADSLKIKDSAAQFTDRSFLVMAAEEPVFGCSLTLHFDQQRRKCIGYFGREASSHINQSSIQAPTTIFDEKLFGLLQAPIGQLIEEIQPHSIEYLDPVCWRVMSPMTQVLLNHGGRPVPQRSQLIDISIAERELHRNMSKSCRGMVEWGRRHLDIEIVHGDCFDASTNEHFVSINLEKVFTENNKFIYESLVKRGNGFLVQGRYRNELVARSLFVHNNKTSHQVFAENKSGSLDRPVLHALIWEAILHSKRASCSQFDFGSIAIWASSKNSVKPDDFNASSFGGERHVQLRITLKRTAD